MKRISPTAAALLLGVLLQAGACRSGEKYRYWLKELHGAGHSRRDSRPADRKSDRAASRPQVESRGHLHL